MRFNNFVFYTNTIKYPSRFWGSRGYKWNIFLNMLDQLFVSRVVQGSPGCSHSNSELGIQGRDLYGGRKTLGPDLFGGVQSQKRQQSLWRFAGRILWCFNGPLRCMAEVFLHFGVSDFRNFVLHRLLTTIQRFQSSSATHVSFSIIHGNRVFGLNSSRCVYFSVPLFSTVDEPWPWPTGAVRAPPPGDFLRGLPSVATCAGAFSTRSRERLWLIEVREALLGPVEAVTCMRADP